MADMADIETLLGPVPSDDLGIVAMHEHILYGLHGWQWAPDFAYDRAEAYETTRDALLRFKARGGGTIVDVCGLTNGRDVNFYARLSENTGVHIVAATGFKNQTESIPGHFLGRAYRSSTDSALHWLREIPGSFYPSHGESMEYLMFIFFNELTEGMAAPGMVRTKMKAALVRTGSGWDDISKLEEYSLRGAAVAAVKSGAFVYIEGVGQIERQLEILASHDLPFDRVVVGNCDDRRGVDSRRDQALAAQGLTIAYDHVGWEDSADDSAIPDAQRVDLVKAMVDAGFADRVVLSCSAIGYPLGGRASPRDFAHLLENFVPALKNAGVGADAIQTMLVENPARLLASAQEGPSRGRPS